MRRSIPAFVLIAAALAVPARAGEPETHRTVVRPAPSMDHWSKPSSILTRAVMQDAGADLPAVLDDEPGLNATRLGGLGSFSLLSIRGSTGDQVRLYVDGIPLNSAEGGPVDLSTLPLGPVASIAIYRGVSPVVFGSSAIGGTLDIRTRRLGGHHLEVEAGGGSFGTREARLFYGTGGDTWAAGASVDYRGSEGDFTFPSDGGTAWTTEDDAELVRTNNRFDQIAVMLKGRLEPAPGLRLTVLDLVTHMERGLPGIGLQPTRRAHLAQTRNLLGLRVEALADRRFQLGATAYLAWSRTALDDPLGELGSGADRTRDESWIPGLTIAARAPAPLDEDGDWTLTPIVAAAWRTEIYAPDKASGPAAGQPDATRHVLSLASELQLAAAPVDATLTGAVRHESAWAQQKTATSPVASDWSWRVGLEQRPAPHTSWTLSASRSLRLPSLYELFGDTGYVLGNPALQPERGLMLEAGVTHDALWIGDAGRWRVEVAGFVTWVDDLIQLVQNAQGVARPENLDAARLAGVELGTDLDLLRHLRLRGGLTWLSAIDTGRSKAGSGRQLPFRPEWKGHVRLEGYHDFTELSGGAVGEVGVRVELDATAGNHLDRANLVDVPARVLVGAGVHAWFWRDQLRLDVSVRNLTDSHVQDLAGYPLPGLSAMATLRWVPELPP